MIHVTRKWILNKVYRRQKTKNNEYKSKKIETALNKYGVGNIHNIIENQLNNH